jgi:excinuclease ABC subunit C
VTDTPDRFHEEKSAYTVRGTDKPDIEAGVAAIRNVVKTLPVRPGVYRMLDAKGRSALCRQGEGAQKRVTNYTRSRG